MQQAKLTPRLALEERKTSQFAVEFESATGTLWGYFEPIGNPCFSLGLLADIRTHDSALQVHNGHVLHEGAMHKVHYYVAASRTPGVYNLGGDLSLFVMLIRLRDREALSHYARLCIDNIYPRLSNYFCPTLTTISLVQGAALGGGFETALASDVIVAEEGAQMGLPEVLFNLFPGMGAYSLLARRIGMRAAEQLILSGRIWSAAELHGMGLVDVLAAHGQGEAATREWIMNTGKRRNGMQAVFQARKQVHPITREELDRIAEVWVDAALRLEEKDLKMMARLVRSQSRRHGAAEAARAAEAPELLAASA
ncbi:MAG: crotonase/enoyl-CoA hydratase family protein [Burkholderiales bacterium]|nr:crotonase/enoyl-CoA hydratase family protein [Burkholderiales bacterium]